MRKITTVFICGLLICATAALIVAPNVARADTVNVTAQFNFSSLGTNTVNLNTNYDDSGYDPGQGPAQTYVGVYSFAIGGAGLVDQTVSNPPPNPAPPQDVTLAEAQAAMGVASSSNGVGTTFQAVCVDFTHDVFGGTTYNWNVGKLTDIGNMANGVGISPQQAAAVDCLANMYAIATASDGGQNPQDDAVFQMAVWDLIYNGQDAMGNPTAYSSMMTNIPSLAYTGYSGNAGDVATAANEAAVAWNWAGTYSDSNYDPYALISTTGAQDFSLAIVVTNPDIAPVVPAPAAGLAMVAGIGLIVVVRALRQRTFLVA